MIQLELFGDLTAWAAPRLGPHGIAYNPKSKEKELTRWQIKAIYRDNPLAGAIQLDFTFYFPIPKGTSGIRRRQMLAHVILPCVKPDTTNLQKFYEDCLSGIVIDDDRFATDIASRKRYSERPGVLIRVIPLNASVPSPSTQKDVDNITTITSLFKKNMGENNESC